MALPDAESSERWVKTLIIISLVSSCLHKNEYGVSSCLENFYSRKKHCRPIPHNEVVRMLPSLFFALCFLLSIGAKHFDGGTIRWEPVNPSDIVSPVTIRIIQSYSWAYPSVVCADDVPISTSSRSNENENLTCVADCSSDGGYSARPIDILTDCKTVSTSLGIMTSESAKNVSLSVGAHFYLAHEGRAWVTLNDPPQADLEWSIVTYIDLTVRTGGFINTPPVATVMSPQYAFVNKTIQIPIVVSDANAGDDVRCRWATYTPGYRRRRDSRHKTREADGKPHSIEKRYNHCKYVPITNRTKTWILY